MYANDTAIGIHDKITADGSKSLVKAVGSNFSWKWVQIGSFLNPTFSAIWGQELNYTGDSQVSQNMLPKILNEIVFFQNQLAHGSGNAFIQNDFNEILRFESNDWIFGTLNGTANMTTFKTGKNRCIFT